MGFILKLYIRHKVDDAYSVKRNKKYFGPHVNCESRVELSREWWKVYEHGVRRPPTARPVASIFPLVLYTSEGRTRRVSEVLRSAQ